MRENLSLISPHVGELIYEIYRQLFSGVARSLITSTLSAYWAYVVSSSILQVHTSCTIFTIVEIISLSLLMWTPNNCSSK